MFVFIDVAYWCVVVLDHEVEDETLEVCWLEY